MILDALEFYISQGWPVFPLAEGSKKPELGSNGFHDAHLDRNRLDEFEDRNVGIATGHGMWVLDVDPDKDGHLRLAELEAEFGPLPETRTHRTRSGGTHFLWKMPVNVTIRNSNSLPAGIDVRGLGGYVVAPPSTVEGGTYSVLSDAPVTDAPEWLVKKVTAKPERERGELREFDPDLARFHRSLVEKALRDETRAIIDAPFGDQNNIINKAAYLLGTLIGAGVLDEEEARSALQTAAAEGGHPEDRAAGAIESGFRDGIAKPRKLADVKAVADALAGNQTAISQQIPALPPEFWNSRETLRQIRQAAHAHVASSDLILHCVLARLSAMVGYEAKVDTGFKSPVSLNYFTIPIGPSGGGKSTGMAVARKLLPNDDLKETQIGSGQGLVETYFGTVPNPEREDGGPRYIKQQVIYRALFVSDEGQSLVKQRSQNSNMTFEVLRSMWSGAGAGQRNGSMETTRELERDSYRAAAIIGFQPSTVSDLLADVAGGTPQRFMFCTALDASIPEEQVEDPGPLTGYATAGLGFRVAASIKAKLRAQSVQQMRGESQLPAGDEQRPAHLLKTAALLALLEGRYDITEEDWRLAEVIRDTSMKVYEYLLAVETVRKTRKELEQREARAKDAAASTVASVDAQDELFNRKVARVAENIIDKVRQFGPLTKSALRKKIAARDRKEYFDLALDMVVEDGQVLRNGDMYVINDAFEEAA